MSLPNNLPESKKEAVIEIGELNKEVEKLVVPTKDKENEIEKEKEKEDSNVWEC